MTGRRLLVLLASGVFAGTASAQVDLAAAIRAGTERYRDQAAAVADGYRRVGPDFPSMGEHWVNAALLVGGALDPARPQVLEYATVAGHPTLLGVAFAVLTTDSLSPAGLPVPPSAWHTHAGAVDEESFVLSHAEASAHDHGMAARTPGPRIAILHAWAWLDNPAGLLATDNWAVPFARLGFAAPDSISPAAGRGAALAAGGVDYFTTLVRVVGHPDSSELERLGAIFGAAAGEITARLGRGAGATRLSAEELAYLAEVWTRTWAAVEDAASPPVRERLAAAGGR